jgi:hypothetical protein
MKQWQWPKTRVINASHERKPCPLLFLVLLSQAAGGGRIALNLKKVPSEAFPKAASATGGFFVAAFALGHTAKHPGAR